MPITFPGSLVEAEQSVRWLAEQGDISAATALQMMIDQAIDHQKNTMPLPPLMQGPVNSLLLAAAAMISMPVLPALLLAP